MNASDVAADEYHRTLSQQPASRQPYSVLDDAAELASLPVPATLRPIDSISFEDVEVLNDDEALVTWSFIYDSLPRTTLVELEYEAGDYGQGGYWHAWGDCPKAVRDRAAEAASLKQADNEPDGDADWDSRCDYEPDDDDRMEAF